MLTSALFKVENGKVVEFIKDSEQVVDVGTVGMAN